MVNALTVLAQAVVVGCASFFRHGFIARWGSAGLIIAEGGEQSVEEVRLAAR